MLCWSRSWLPSAPISRPRAAAARSGGSPRALAEPDAVAGRRQRRGVAEHLGRERPAVPGIRGVEPRARGAAAVGGRPGAQDLQPVGVVVGVEQVRHGGRRRLGRRGRRGPRARAASRCPRRAWPAGSGCAAPCRRARPRRSRPSTPWPDPARARRRRPGRAAAWDPGRRPAAGCRDPVTTLTGRPPEDRTAYQRSGSRRAWGGRRHADSSSASGRSANAGSTGSAPSGGVVCAGRSAAFVGSVLRATHAARAAPKRSASCCQAAARASSSAPARQSCDQ